MATITFTFLPEQVPAGYVCRLYHTDNSEYIGEAVSDGTGTVVVQALDEWLHEILVRVIPDNAPGETDVAPIRMVIE